MKTWQKILKIGALVLAGLLILALVSGAVSTISGTGGLLHILDITDLKGDDKTYDLQQDITDLKLTVNAGTVNIRLGDAFTLESNHRHLEVTQKDGTLKVQDKKNFLNIGDASDVYVTLTLPETELEKAEITTGAGVANIAWLSAKELRLELGAGEVNIRSIHCQASARIEGGTGRLNIDSGSIRDLRLEMGVGELNLKAQLWGNSKLEFGIGKANVTLAGDPDAYSISFEKGIGSAQLAGNSLEDGKTVGNGENTVRLESGIGSIQIEFA